MAETNQQQELQTTIIRVKTPKDPDSFAIQDSTATLKKGELFFNPKNNYLYAGTHNGVQLKNLEPINRVHSDVIRLFRAGEIQTQGYDYIIPVTAADNIKGIENNYYTDYDFEIYAYIPEGMGWERNPNTTQGTNIVLDFGDNKKSKKLKLYLLGRNKNDLEAPSGSFQENSIVRFYVRSSGNTLDGIYITPAISLWA